MYNRSYGVSIRDSASIAHLARHRIKPGEVEEFFQNDPAIEAHDTNEGEERWTAVGATNELRILVIVFTVRGDRIRAITGWKADGPTKQQFFKRDRRY